MLIIPCISVWPHKLPFSWSGHIDIENSVVILKMAENKIKWTVILTEEQKWAVEAFFNHSDWDIEVVSEEPYPLPAAAENENAQSDVRCGITTNEASSGTDIQTNTVMMAPRPSQPRPTMAVCEDVTDPEACPYCFLNPCCTTFRQGWLGHGQAAHARNHSTRKEKYRKFWSLLGALGAWVQPLYLAKKARVLHNEVSREELVWAGGITVREIMPECVLKLVRGLYPNLPGVPYMGHKWSFQ